MQHLKEVPRLVYLNVSKSANRWRIYWNRLTQIYNASKDRIGWFGLSKIILDNWLPGLEALVGFARFGS